MLNRTYLQDLFYYVIEEEQNEEHFTTKYKEVHSGDITQQLDCTECRGRYNTTSSGKLYRQPVNKNYLARLLYISGSCAISTDTIHHFAYFTAKNFMLPHNANSTLCYRTAQNCMLPHSSHPTLLPHSSHSTLLPHSSHPTLLPHSSHFTLLPHNSHPTLLPHSSHFASASINHYESVNTPSAPCNNNPKHT